MNNNNESIITRLSKALEQLGGIRRASKLYENEVGNPINVTVVRKIMTEQRVSNFTYMLVYVLERIHADRMEMLEEVNKVNG